MILFFHGLDSDNQTTKFTAISHPHKYCETVDYRCSDREDISRHYDELITRYSPVLLVGHSLGGYWALVKSQQHGLPCVLVNPQLYPSFRADYSELEIAGCDDGVLRFAYLELGDEVLDIQRIRRALDGGVAELYCADGGHHRVADLARMDSVVRAALERIQQQG
ncbi:YqiA/YcfP family alpha/beta fold hydrolase [Zobellella denitrificans]|nr:YqiA/YcfP family alpha/beta fold hydrolase [Zobellella denitrificans]